MGRERIETGGGNPLAALMGVSLGLWAGSGLKRMTGIRGAVVIVSLGLWAGSGLKHSFEWNDERGPAVSLGLWAGSGLKQNHP